MTWVLLALTAAACSAGGITLRPRLRPGFVLASLLG
jgi:hypothetical protein